MGSGDGILRYRDGIAVAQVILFSTSFWYAVHFRWTRRIGWFCIGVFSILRLVGAGCMLGHRQEELESPVGGGVRVRVVRHHSAHIHAAGDAGENVCCRAGIERRNEELIKSVVFQKQSRPHCPPADFHHPASPHLD